MLWWSPGFLGVAKLNEVVNYAAMYWDWSAAIQLFLLVGKCDGFLGASFNSKQITNDMCLRWASWNVTAK